MGSVNRVQANVIRCVLSSPMLDGCHAFPSCVTGLALVRDQHVGKIVHSHLSLHRHVFAGTGDDHAVDECQQAVFLRREPFAPGHNSIALDGRRLVAGVCRRALFGHSSSHKARRRTIGGSSSTRCRSCSAPMDRLLVKMVDAGRIAGRSGDFRRKDERACHSDRPARTLVFHRIGNSVGTGDALDRA